MNPYENLQAPANIGNALMQGYQQGRQQRRERDLDNALTQYALNPGAEESMAGIIKADPRLGIQLQRQQQEAAMKQLEAKRDQIKLGAQIIGALKPQDEASWQRALAVAQQAGIDLTEVPQQYNPEYVQGLISINQALNPEKNTDTTNMREYAIAQSQGFKGSFLDFLGAKQGPMGFSNGDGTYTIVPRQMLGQPQTQQASAPPVPPPPGFVIDEEGGQTGSAPSAGFPF